MNRIFKCFLPIFLLFGSNVYASQDDVTDWLLLKQSSAKKISPVISFLLSESPVTKGFLIDGIVTGDVTYRTTSGYQGRLNGDGSFDYEDRDRIEFFVGGKKLGEAEASQIVSILEFSNPERVAVLLHGLDKDGNRANGIEISESISARLANAPFTVENVDPNDDDFIAMFEASMGYPLQTDEGSAQDHAWANLQAELIDRVDPDFFRFMNESLGTKGLIGADEDGRTIAGLTPDNYNNTYLSRVRTYFASRVLGNALELEIQLRRDAYTGTLTRQQQVSDKFNSLLNHTTQIIGILGLGKSVYIDDATTLLGLAKDGVDATRALDYAGVEIAEVDGNVFLRELISPTTPYTRLLGNCVGPDALTPASLIQCGLSAGGEPLSSIYDLYRGYDGIIGLRRLNAAIVAKDFFDLYYWMGGTPQAMDAVLDAMDIRFDESGVATGNCYNDFDSIRGNGVWSRLEQALDLIWAIRVGKNDCAGFTEINYNFEEARAMLEDYEASIDRMVNKFVYEFNTDILKEIDGNYLDANLELNSIENDQYSFCLDIKNKSAFDLKNLSGSLQYDISRFNSSAITKVFALIEDEKLRPGEESFRRCTNPFSLDTSNNLIDVYGVVKATYELSFTPDRFESEVKMQSGDEYYELSKVTLIDQIERPHIRITSPTIVSPGQQVHIDASRTFGAGGLYFYAWNQIGDLSDQNISVDLTDLIGNPVSENHAHAYFVAPEIPDGIPFIRLRFRLSAAANGSETTEEFSIFVRKSEDSDPPKVFSLLNDTGSTFSGAYPSGNDITCTGDLSAKQDCGNGRDSTHNDDSDGHAGFSFTKLGAGGIELTADALNWSCVFDNITGLTWEVKTTDTTPHNKDNFYQWGGLTALGRDSVDREGSYYDDWNELVEYANDNALCGSSDWRLPTLKELQTISNKGASNPAIDVNYFPNTPTFPDTRDLEYWTSSPHAGGNNTLAWIVDIYSGTDNFQSRDTNSRVRLVTSGSR